MDINSDWNEMNEDNLELDSEHLDALEHFDQSAYSSFYEHEEHYDGTALEDELWESIGRRDA